MWSRQIQIHATGKFIILADMPNPPSSEDSDPRPYYSGDSVYYGGLYSYSNSSNSSTTTVPLYRKSSFVKTNYWILTESEMRKVLMKKQTREISTEENTVLPMEEI
jgi:hypothetical protein